MFIWVDRRREEICKSNYKGKTYGERWSQHTNINLNCLPQLNAVVSQSWCLPCLGAWGCFKNTMMRVQSHSYEHEGKYFGRWGHFLFFKNNAFIKKSFTHHTIHAQEVEQPKHIYAWPMGTDKGVGIAWGAGLGVDGMGPRGKIGRTVIHNQ